MPAKYKHLVVSVRNTELKKGLSSKEANRIAYATANKLLGVPKDKKR